MNNKSIKGNGPDVEKYKLSAKLRYSMILKSFKSDLVIIKPQ